MTRRWILPRTLVALAVVAAVVAALSLSGRGGGSQATVASSTTAASGSITDMTVVGDSITALYDDRPGSPMQGWWSIVGRHLGVPVERYAQSGSGYLKVGAGCAGDTFADRPGALASAPSLLVLEGGRNDWSICRGGRAVTAPDETIRAAVDSYMDAVAATVPASTRVVVLGPPWGPVKRQHAERVTAIVREAAQEHDFEFVDMTGTLDASTVYDGIHPTLEGSRRIAARVVSALEGARA